MTSSDGSRVILKIIPSTSILPRNTDSPKKLFHLQKFGLAGALNSKRISADCSYYQPLSAELKYMGVEDSHPSLNNLCSKCVLTIH